MNRLVRLGRFLRQLKQTSEREDVCVWHARVVRRCIFLWRFIQITVREFLDDRLLLRAMALTFATLLSLIPFLAIMFSMFKLFGGGEWFMNMLEPVLMRNLAPGSGEIVAQRIEGILESSSGTAVGGIGLIFLVLMVYGIFSAIENTFNLIWGVKSRAGALNRLPLYWGLVSIIPILVVSSLALTTYIKALPLVHQAVQHVNIAESVIGRALSVFMVTFSFFLLYRLLPGTRVRTSAALTGAISAGLLYEVVKVIFIFYSGKLVKYDIFYGSLAIIPLLMVWINLSWIVVLLGVEICFVSQHYRVLVSERKHVKFSRLQKDALAFLILTEVTRAFRGKRDAVTADEWVQRFGVPPGVIAAVIDKLCRGGMIERAGTDGNILLLKRDPDYIRIGDIDRILSGESLEEWSWPDEPHWRWLKSWMRKRRDAESGQMDGVTLGELVSDLDVVEKVDGQRILRTPSTLENRQSE